MVGRGRSGGWRAVLVGIVGAVLLGACGTLPPRGSEPRETAPDPLERVRERAVAIARERGDEDSPVGEALRDLGPWATGDGEAPTRPAEGEGRAALGDGLYALGVALMREDQRGPALPYLEQALALREAGRGRGDPSVGQALNRLAILHELEERDAVAESYYLRALRLFEARADETATATVLYNLGDLYADQDRAADAEPLLLRAVEIRERRLGPDHVDVARVLWDLGELLWDEDRLEEARPFLERALAIYEARYGPEREITGDVAHDLARLHEDADDRAAVDHYFRRALRAYEAAGDELEVARLLYNLADFYGSQGEYARALDMLQRSLALREAHLGPDSTQVAAVLERLARLHLELNRFEEAEALARRSLAIREVQPEPDPEDVVDLLEVMAVGAGGVQAFARADAYLERARRTADAGELSPERRASLSTVHAFVRVDQGRYAEAEPLLREAVAILEGHADSEFELGGALIALAQLYLVMGDWDRARPVLERLDRLVAGKGPAYDGYRILAGIFLGAILDDRVRAAEALDLALRRYGERHPLVARAHFVMALTGGPGGRLAAVRQAFEIYETSLGPDNGVTLMAESILGALESERGDFAAAGRHLEHSVLGTETIGMPDARWRALGQYAAHLERVGERRAAIFFGKRAIAVLQESRASIRDMDVALQAAYVQTAREVYESVADWLIAEGRLPEAVEILGLLKENEYHEFTRRTVPRGDGVPMRRGEREREQALARAGASLAALGRELEGLRERKHAALMQGAPALSEAEEARLQELREGLARAQRAFAAELARIREELRAGGRIGTLESRNLGSLRTLQPTLRRLGDGVVVLHYLVTADALKIILTSAGAQLSRSVPVGREELSRLVFDLRAALTDPGRDPRPAAAAVHARVLAPVRDELAGAGASTLMLSLDGALRYVPFAALWDPARERFLVEDFAFSLYTEAARNTLERAPPETLLVAGLGVGRPIEGFAPLPAVERELERIVRRDAEDPDGVAPGVIHLDETFSRPVLRDVLESRYPVLHIASHFVFRSGTEEDSFLLLGDGSRLTLGSMRTEDWSFAGVDLIALSACETALGSGADGAEIEGFGALAQRQGALGVLATLWPVADESTAALMERFYAARLGGAGDDPATKAAALRRAQLALLRGELAPAPGAPGRRGSWSLAGEEGKPRSAAGAWTHPYHWAAFILMGNWR